MRLCKRFQSAAAPRAAPAPHRSGGSAAARAGQLQICRAHALKELRGLDLEAIGRRIARAPLRARQAEARPADRAAACSRGRAADVSPAQALRSAGDHAAPCALVGARGVRKAITDDPFAARKRGPDQVFHVNAARGEHQQRLGRRHSGLSAALENDGAHALGQRRAARLARQADADGRVPASHSTNGGRPSTCPRPRCPRG